MKILRQNCEKKKKKHYLQVQEAFKQPKSSVQRLKQQETSSAHPAEIGEDDESLPPPIHSLYLLKMLDKRRRYL